MITKPSILSTIRDSFSYHLMVTVATIIVLSSMSLNLYYFWHEIRGLRENYIQQGRNMGALLAEDSRLGIFTANPKDLTSHAKAIMAAFTCRMVALYDGEGKVVISVNNSQFLRDPARQRNLLGGVAFRLLQESDAVVEQSLLFEGDDQVVITPIVAASQFSAEGLYFDEEFSGTRPLAEPETVRPLGYAVIFLDSTHIDKQAAAIFFKNTGVSLLVALLSCLAIMFGLKLLTAPLRDLVREIRVKNSEEGSADELATIPADCTVMIDSIRRSYLTIENLKEHLEETVRERTAELVESNSELALQKTMLEQTNVELGQALHALKSTQNQLIQSEKMAALGQLIAGLSHEINNALNFITGAIPLLDRNLKKLADLNGSEGEASGTLVGQTLEGRNKTLMGNIMEGAHRITELTRNLRVYSYNNQHDFAREDIHKGLAASIGIVRSRYGKKIRIEEEFARDLPKVFCNLGQLNQVFMNLLLNAAQAIDDEGTITVKTTWDEGVVRVAVTDTGEGIPAERIGEVFNPFFTTKKVGEGSGLGLSISYTIINRHGGKIAIDSRPGEGTTFEVTLPY